MHPEIASCVGMYHPVELPLLLIALDGLVVGLHHVVKHLRDKGGNGHEWCKRHRAMK